MTRIERAQKPEAVGNRELRNPKAESTMLPEGRGSERKLDNLLDSISKNDSSDGGKLPEQNAEKDIKSQEIPSQINNIEAGHETQDPHRGEKLLDSFLDKVAEVRNARSEAKIEKAKTNIESGKMDFKFLPGDIFVCRIGNEVVTLSKVEKTKLEYTKRNPDDVLKDREKFNNSVRGKFLKDLGANHEEELKQKGFSEDEINMIKAGKVPPGYQVHHKKSLDDGGTNQFDNLVLIDKDSHSVITAYQKRVTNGMVAGDCRKVDWPDIKGNIYNGGI